MVITHTCTHTHAHNGGGEPWRQAVVMLTTVFNRYDAFQIPNMMQDCFGNATDKFGGKHCAGSDFTAWGDMVDNKVKSWLATAQAKKSGHAAFISACFFHCGSNPTFGVVKCAKLR